MLSKNIRTEKQRFKKKIMTRLKWLIFEKKAKIKLYNPK